VQRFYGGMAEWFKAAVLKTAVPRGTVGSNPTPSAKKRVPVCRAERGEMAELAEGARLLSECSLKRATEGSNPSLSAILIPSSTSLSHLQNPRALLVV
jgi:hypothetical protein